MAHLSYTNWALCLGATNEYFTFLLYLLVQDYQLYVAFFGFLDFGTLARAEDSLDTISPLKTNILTPRSSTIPSVRTAEIYIKQLNLYRERFDTEASHLSLEECVQLGLTKSPLLGAAFLQFSKLNSL